jgi:hypothetical protein
VQTGRLGRGLLTVGGFGYRADEKRPAAEALISSIAMWMASIDSSSVSELPASQEISDILGLKK